MRQLSTNFLRFPVDKLCPNGIELANFGNSSGSILQSIPLFIKWHGKVYKQTFHINDVNGSPNLLSRKSCFMMEILKLCFHLSSKKMSPSLSNSIKSATDGKQEAKLLSIKLESVTLKLLTKEQVLETYKDVLRELELFLDHHINSSWNLMQFHQNILHRKFLFICRKPLHLWSCWPRNIGTSGTFHWMGQFICDCRERSFHQFFRLSFAKPYDNQEIEDLSGSPWSEWSTRMRAILFQISQQNYWKISPGHCVHYHGYEKGILDACITSRFQSTHMHNTRYWKIPMD